METDEMLDRVEHKWPFTAENYPALARLTEQQGLVFAATHILRHQSSAWLYGTDMNPRNPALELERRLLAFKVLFNSIRYGQVVNFGVNNFSRWWDSWLPPSRTRLISRAHTWRQGLDELSRTTLFSLNSMETVEHGHESSFTLVHVSDFLRSANKLIYSVRGVQRLDFEEWLKN
jgi:hypothetical protein